MKGLLTGVDPTTHSYYNYFPMPYGTSARIVLVNSSGQTITNATGVTQYNPTAYSNLNTDSGYFVAQYNREAPPAPKLGGLSAQLASCDGFDADGPAFWTATTNRMGC